MATASSYEKLTHHPREGARQGRGRSPRRPSLEAKTILEAAKAAERRRKGPRRSRPAPDAPSAKKRKRSTKANAGAAAKDSDGEVCSRFRSWRRSRTAATPTAAAASDRLLAQAFPGSGLGRDPRSGPETARPREGGRAADGDDSDGDDEDGEGADVSAPSAGCKMQRHIEEHLRPGARRFVAAHQRRRYAGTLAILFGATQDVSKPLFMSLLSFTVVWLFGKSRAAGINFQSVVTSLNVVDPGCSARAALLASTL